MIVLATAAATAATVVGLQSATAAGPEASDSSAPQKVIVVLRDQLTSTPANKKNMAPRTSRAVSTQNSLINSLTGPKLTHVKHFSVGNAFSATVTAAQAAALASNSQVLSVIPDRAVVVTPDAADAAPAGGAQSNAVQPNAVGTDGQICPSDPADPLVEPEALQSVKAISTGSSPGADQLASGAGVKVGFIADSLDINNPDFIRPDGSHVFFDYQDFSGDGPSAISDGREAFGDASSIAAQGTVVHDLSNFVNQAHPLPPGCNIVVRGVAPGASLAGYVFGSNASILQAIDYAVSTDHVDVLNESFGLNSYPDFSMRNALTIFNDAAVDAGVTVTVSSGDAGITNTIGSPPDPKVIQVAATTDFRLYAQTTYGAFPFSNGTWTDDNISALSSSGISQYARTVDLAAPGEGNWAVCEATYTGCRNFRSPTQGTDLQSFGGTSESAPLTAGVAALVIEAYRSTHAGASPSPATIKEIITGTATDLGLPADEQGSGLLNARAATEAALSYPGGGSVPAGVASNIITSTNQMTLTGNQGGSKTGKFSVVNVGTQPVTVVASSRTFTPDTTSSQTVAFDASSLPTFTYYNGATWAQKTVHFTVPAGAQRLLARMAFTQVAAAQTDAVRLTLLDPSGRYIANSRPQGNVPDYANVDVRNPAAGSWTAVLYSLAGTGGFHGNIKMQFDTQQAAVIGAVTPHTFTLAPGASKVVSAKFTLPASGGDTDYSVTLATSAGQKTSVSAVLQTLINTAAGGAFGGTITGGNARAVSPGETFSYGFNVPSGKHDMSVSMHLTDNQDVVDAVLLDPNGELADVGSNVVLTDPSTLGQGSTIQLFDATPIAGQWQLIIVVQNPVAGNAIAKPFTGAITFNKLNPISHTLPNSSATVIPNGHTITANVNIKNTGVAPIAVGADARLNRQATVPLFPIQGSENLTLPDNGSDAPIYLVPPETSNLTVAAVSSLPAQVEVQGSAAGFDVFGDLAAAQGGSTVSIASIDESRKDVAQGIWFTTINEIGPFSDAGQPSGTSTLSASAVTAVLDTSVVTSVGDPYDGAFHAGGDIFGNPMILMPGESGKFTVQITANGHPGQVVTGHINLVTPSTLPVGNGGLPFYTTGELMTSIPYSYTIG